MKDHVYVHIFQGSASECILVAMLTARHHAIKRLRRECENEHDSTFLPKLVAYYSQETHSSVEKAANICLVHKHCLDTDVHYRLDGCTLEEAIEEDIKCGLTPFFVVATLGTTNMSAFDKLLEIVNVCRCYDDIWIHVDATYAGNCFVCPENRHLMEGIQCVDSFNCNPHEWILVVPDCSVIYYKELCKVNRAMHVEHDVANFGGDDLDSFSLSQSRRFRAMKLWYIFRSYGIEGLQAHIRRACCLAKCFKALVKQDNRFEVINDVQTGLVCFKLNGSNEVNQKLLESINCEGQIYLTPTVVKRRYLIRFSVNYQKASEQDIYVAWKIIKRHADKFTRCNKIC
ncbi:Aromatic-L-amino-acid decarboxylase [Blattella germanica]|nr:Aromatic-L-amino-acid decarboxylase [Blattella germanica]